MSCEKAWQGTESTTHTKVVEKGRERQAIVNSSLSKSLPFWRGVGESAWQQTLRAHPEEELGQWWVKGAQSKG